MTVPSVRRARALGRVSRSLAAPDAAPITRWRRCRPSEDAQSAFASAPSQRAPGRRRHPPRIGRHALAPLLLALALGGTACSGDEKKDEGAPERPPEDVLAAAKQILDDTSGVQITLQTGNLPSGVSAGIVKAEGTGVHPSAFQGTFDLSVSGIPATAEVIAVDGTTYAKNSLLLPQWTEIDPADYGAPDPAQLMEPDVGFSALLAAAEGLEAGETTRGGTDNKEILTQYTGTLPAEAVAGLIPTAEGDFAVTYEVSDDDELRGADIEGAFYGADLGEVTYRLSLEDYGTEQEIVAP